MTVIYENVYGDYLGLSGAIEHFIDDLPIEWGNDLQEQVEINSSIDDIYRGKWKLTNKEWFEVEIYLNEDTNEWKCVAYE